MTQLKILLLALAALLLVALPLRAQPRPGSQSLPVKRVVLFSSGVGYFEREGTIDGAAHIDLQFPEVQINDLLKSLVVEEQGGQVGAISYDNRNPIDKTLKSFALDLTNNPTLGQLYGQARGERIEADLNVGSPMVAGTIVGVEKITLPADKDKVFETEQLNVLTDSGLRGILLRDIRQVRFTRESLNQEFQKALAVLAAGHNKDKKVVTLSFTGQGKRGARVGYVIENPIWKTSYRLELAQEKVYLQGWAIVENTSDEDWNSVRLALVSGRPISFMMDLYEPLFVSRPTVEPELFASLRPPTYAGNLGTNQFGFGGEGAGRVKPRGMRVKAPEFPAPPPSSLADGKPRESAMLERLGETAVSAASTTDLGNFFQYAIDQPVTLARQKSALIPIVAQDVGGSRVSIYNEAVQAKYPLLGLRFKNGTPLHLNQGPVTVFDSNAYAGDARIPDLQPNETRLLSYAIDLGTEVSTKREADDRLVTVKIVKGLMDARYSVRDTKTYTIKNRSGQTRTVLVEHPIRNDYKLLEPAKPAEKARDVYRFEVEAKPNEPTELKVIEELPRLERVGLIGMDDSRINFFISSRVVNEKVKAALAQAMALKNKHTETNQHLEKEEEALKTIDADQQRMRENMAKVPPTSDVYKRWLKKFDDQETEIEQRRDKVSKLRDLATQQFEALQNYLANLTVDPSAR
jgi:hypothetical protein